MKPQTKDPLKPPQKFVAPNFPTGSAISWGPSLETLTKEEAERCQALSWSHEEAQRWCMTWNTRLVFPSIILATFSGAGAVGSEQLLPFSGATTLVGVVSLFVGVLQTIQNYFDFAKNAEAHRIAALQYNKMQSQLSMQLSLPRVERKPAEEIIEWISNERDRLSEIVPILPQIIKDKFKREFGDLESFALPSNLNGLKSVMVVKEEEKKADILFFPTNSSAAQIAKLHSATPTINTPTQSRKQSTSSTTTNTTTTNSTTTNRTETAEPLQSK